MYASGTYQKLNRAAWFAGLLVGLFLQAAHGQDAIFSQQESATGLLNPALAGSRHSMYGSAMYRKQSVGGVSAFKTVYAGAEARLSALGKNGTNNNQKNGLAAGIYLLGDWAGDPQLRTSMVSTAVSYHARLSETSKVGAGLMVGFDQHSIQPASGKWASQYNGLYHDPNLPSGEIFAADRQMHLNFGAGVVYNFSQVKKKVRVFRKTEASAGVSVFNAGRVAIREGDYLDYRVEQRYSAFATGRFNLGVGRFAAEPALWYHSQGPNQHITAGGMIRYMIDDASTFMSDGRPTSLGAGAYLRSADAMIYRLNFEWADYAVGLAYEMGLGLPRTGMPRRNAVEVVLVYRKL